MKKIKCDICDGEITMQANRIGVCKQCGMEYSVDAIKAMIQKNNSQVAGIENSELSISNAHKDEIDRDILISYFYNLRVLESLLCKSEETIKKLDERVDKNKEIESKYLDDCDNVREKINDLENTPIPVKRVNILGVVIIIAIFLLFLLTFDKTCILIGTIMSGSLALYSIKDYQNGKSKEIQKRTLLSDEISKYQSVLQTNINRYEKSKKLYLEQWYKIRDLKASIQKEIDSIKSIISDAYSINIIPQPFRNIEGVFFLYEYLASSNQSLSEALMQANLEAIKQKMDTVIKMQSVQIIQQAKTNAKLNQVIVDTDRIANNTALSAKYSIINAVNSSLIAMLMSESLAYQKAEFYLK